MQFTIRRRRTCCLADLERRTGTAPKCGFRMVASCSLPARDINSGCASSGPLRRGRLPAPRMPPSPSGRPTAVSWDSSRRANSRKCKSRAGLRSFCVTRAEASAVPGIATTIVFSHPDQRRLLCASRSGTESELAPKDDRETNHRWPHFLPMASQYSDGHLCPPSQACYDQRLARSTRQEPVTLFQAESSVAYGSGHLLFWRDGTLMAERFDPTANERRSVSDRRPGRHGGKPLRERVRFGEWHAGVRPWRLTGDRS